MKCPHCQMKEGLIIQPAELRLLSFVFTTIRCPNCAQVFAVPNKKPFATEKKPALPEFSLRVRHAA